MLDTQMWQEEAAKMEKNEVKIKEYNGYSYFKRNTGGLSKGGVLVPNKKYAENSK